MNTLNEDEAWQKWAGNNLRSKRKTLYRVAAAAAVIISFGIGAVLFFTKEPEPASVAKTVTPIEDVAREDHVRIVSANGKVQALPLNQQTNVAFGNAQLDIDQNKVSITAKANTSAEINTLIVPRGFTYKIRLQDQSEVYLNADSRLRFPTEFGSSEREVYLEGEAYFTVQHDAKRPFIVHAGNTKVQVLGTEFNVNNYTTGVVKTALVTGSVSLSVGKSAPGLLTPGKMATTENDKITISTFNKQHELSWMQGRYYFKKVPLSQLGSVISRWYDVKVVFENETLKTSAFSGLLQKDRPLKQFMEEIEITSGIHHYFSGDTLRLK